MFDGDKIKRRREDRAVAFTTALRNLRRRASDGRPGEDVMPGIHHTPRPECRISPTHTAAKANHRCGKYRYRGL